MEQGKIHSSEEIEIDFKEIALKFFRRKKLFCYIVCCSVFIGLTISYSLPKQYKVTVTLSPESGKSGNSNGLSSMASMFGVNMVGMESDAINVSMFPEIIKSTPFLIEMYDTKVETIENKSIDLTEFIHGQKKAWWSHLFQIPNKTISFIFNLFSDSKSHSVKNDSINPFRLTPQQNSDLASIRSVLSVNIDKKTNMTTVSATLHDPLVAAITADSAVSKLQKYIINYRIKKAIENCTYLEKLCRERKEEYLKAQQAYASFMDTNKNVILQRTQAEGTRLQNEMSIAFQIYSQVETQLQMARAKIQEEKPVFAIIEPASVPLSPSSPNKFLIIIGCIFLGIIGCIGWILFGEKLWHMFKQNKKNNQTE